MTTGHNFRDAIALCHRTAAHSSNTNGSIRSTLENVSVEYNFNANALDISSNSLAALAGTGGLHIIQLQSPFVPTMNIFHNTVSTAFHVKFHNNSSLIASTSGSCVLLYDLLSTRNPTLALPTCSNVTGISWSPSNESILAACIQNGNSLLWDLRSGSERPSIQFPVCQPSAATQIQWNPFNAHDLAIVENGGVSIWDTRQVHHQPAVRLGDSQHLIHRMSWHPQAYELITCSDDAQVQMWDIMHPMACRGSVTTPNPVTDIAYTPFGNGFITKSIGESFLRLWKFGFQGVDSYSAEQVHIFNENPSDVINAFAWRSISGGRKFQIVSLVNHNVLSLQHVDPQHVQECDMDGNYMDLGSSFEGSHASPCKVRSPDWDISMLKNDLASIVSASGFPIAAEEYTSSWPDHSGRILLDDEAMKNNLFSPTHSPDNHGSHYNLAEDHRPSFSENDPVITSRLETQMCTLARSLPCPRIYGASFSGPNMLVVFDSRVAIGHNRVNAITNVLFKRKSKVCDTIGEETSDRKKQANSNREFVQGSSLPRTYGELLVTRDSRFARKNQTMTSSVSVAANLASMDLTGSSERGTDNHFDYFFGEDENDFLIAQPLRTIASTGQFLRINPSADIPRSGVFDYSTPTDSLKKSVEDLMPYSDEYVNNAPYRQPGYPLSATSNHQTRNGLESTPQFVTRKGIVDRLSQQKRVLETPSSSNWNLSLCVTLLDLSRLCGVTAVLMYETCLSPEAFVSHNHGNRSINNQDCQHSLAQWIDDQQSSIQMDPTTSIPPKVRKGFWHNMISKSTKSAPFERVCDYNAHISTLGGRPDLNKVWTVLGSVCAAPLYLSLYEEKYDRTLNVTESWKHHPFGLPLIKRVLQMYEQVGDLPSLASLVCVLENQKEVNDATTKTAVVAPLNASNPLPVELIDLSVDSTRTGLLASVEGSHRSKSFGDKWRNKMTIQNSSSSAGSGHPIDARMLSSFGSGVSPVLSPHSPSFLSLLAMKESHPVQHPSEQLSKPFGTATISWKLEFEKLENPFRTWSAGNRELSPPRVSAQLALRLNENTPKGPMRSKLLPPAPSPKHTLDSRAKSLCLRLEIIPNKPNKALLGREPADGNRHAVYKRSYADVLYRYGAVSRRIEILKDRALMSDAHDGIHFGILCWRCQTPSHDSICRACRDFAIQCSLCQLTVRGQSMFCINCGHGGHVDHMRAWFRECNLCPTGCGCWCQDVTGSSLNYPFDPQVAGESNPVGHARSFSF